MGNTVSKETMDYIRNVREAEKVRVATKPKSAPVVAFTEPPVPARRKARLVKPLILARFAALLLFIGSILGWVILMAHFPLTGETSNILNIGLISDREMLMLIDTAVFLVSGLALATYKVMDTINAAASVLAERMNAK